MEAGETLKHTACARARSCMRADMHSHREREGATHSTHTHTRTRTHTRTHTRTRTHAHTHTHTQMRVQCGACAPTDIVFKNKFKNWRSDGNPSSRDHKLSRLAVTVCRVWRQRVGRTGRNSRLTEGGGHATLCYVARLREVEG